MCMMCEEEAMYQAYQDWLAKKEAEEAAAAQGSGANAADAASSAKPAPAAQPASGFVCDGPADA